MVVGTVPVVIGAPNIQDFAPSVNSIIHLASLDQAASVAKRIQYLRSDSEAYKEMIAWKHQGPSDSFLALVDMAIVHSACRLCLYLATRIQLKESESLHPSTWTCKQSWVVFVRERGRIGFERIRLFLPSSMELLFKAVKLHYEKIDYKPIWVGHRKDYRQSSKKLNIYRIYPVTKTQREALYGSPMDDQELLKLLQQPYPPMLEVIFI